MGKYWIPSIFATISYIMVEALRPIHALLFLMWLDIVAGVLLAMERRRLSSAIMLEGLIKKAMILLIVAASYIFDNYFGHKLNIHISYALAVAFSLREILSLVEKAAKAGVWVPRWLVDRLGELQDEKKD